MPLPVALAAIGAGTSLLNNMLNVGATNQANKQNRSYAEQQYDKQRRDAIADWQREADYNSPKQQMARLKEAGLNPNLVYGHGADATMSSVRSSSPQSYKAEAPQFNLDQGLGAIYDLQLRSAQTDNVKAATEVARIEALSKLLGNENLGFDLDQKKQLQPLVLESAKEALEKLKLDVDHSEIDLDKKGRIFDADIKQRISESINAANQAQLSEQQKSIMRANLNLLEKEGKLKDFEIKLNKLGVTKGDTIPYRILSLLLGKFGLKL